MPYPRTYVAGATSTPDIRRGSVTILSTDTVKTVTFAALPSNPTAITLQVGFQNNTTGAYIAPVVDESTISTTGFNILFAAPGVSGVKIYYTAIV